MRTKHWFCLFVLFSCYANPFCCESLQAQFKFDVFATPSPIYFRYASDLKLPQGGFTVKFQNKNFKNPTGLNLFYGIGLSSALISKIIYSRFGNLTSDKYYISIPLSISIRNQGKFLFFESSIFIGPILRMYQYRDESISIPYTTGNGAYTSNNIEYHAGKWQNPDFRADLGLSGVFGCHVNTTNFTYSFGGGITASPVFGIRPIFKLSAWRNLKISSANKNKNT